jgi:hypothetical protein
MTGRLRRNSHPALRHHSSGSRTDIIFGSQAPAELAALLAIPRCENLEIAEQLKAHLEHVEIVVIVIDVEHFGHDVVPIAHCASFGRD